MVRVHETFLRQGDEKGTAHPNLQGHTHNGQAVLAALIQDLYPLGLGGPPRGPDQTFLPDPAAARGRNHRMSN